MLTGLQMFLGATPGAHSQFAERGGIGERVGSHQKRYRAAFRRHQHEGKRSLHWAQPAIRRYCAFPARSHVVTPSCPISNATGRRRSPPQGAATSAAVTVKAATHSLNDPA